MIFVHKYTFWGSRILFYYGLGICLVFKGSNQNLSSILSTYCFFIIKFPLSDPKPTHFFFFLPSHSASAGFLLIHFPSHLSSSQSRPLMGPMQSTYAFTLNQSLHGAVVPSTVAILLGTIAVSLDTLADALGSEACAFGAVWL